ncbi:nucleotide-sugar transporter domain-containing protein [Ditylenchus destructor]|uniref:Nucleotide-sugar transporter domain-containing protein n=1 Tax=Ditylenchus destructor TaxID=166010 RepID=A0AAD4NEY4_9BILA|nr:nucleotide-sugar transporter domain-containing protein [Ditylenchus destructor]
MVKPSSQKTMAKKYETFPQKQTGFLHSLKFKLLILVWYSVQNTIHILLMSYTRSRSVTDIYYPSVAVFFTEVFKFAMCLFMVLKDASFNPLKFLRMLKEQVVLKPRDTLKVCIPTMVYVFQNNILYVGASHLNATAFMITLQLKLASAAIFSIILLKRRLNVLHWTALITLFVGVCVVQLNGAKHKKHTSAVGNQIPLLGFGATVLGCVTSGFAGVFLEKILKDASPVSLWMRNVQMALFAIPSSFATVAIKDGAKVLSTSLLHGFDWVVWGQIIWLSIGGLTVGACIKYADNITKDFSTSMAIILATIGSIWLFHFAPSWMFAVGAGMVIGGIFLYSYSGKLWLRVQQSKENSEPKDMKKPFKIFQLRKWGEGKKAGGNVVVPMDASNTIVVVDPTQPTPQIEVFVVNTNESDSKCDKLTIMHEVDLEKCSSESSIEDETSKTDEQRKLSTDESSLEEGKLSELDTIEEISEEEDESPFSKSDIAYSKLDETKSEKQDFDTRSEKLSRT